MTDTPPATDARFPIAYVAGQFPLRSETFVWREVRALRDAGWPVHTFGLHAPHEETPANLADLRAVTQDVYGARWPRRFRPTDLPAVVRLDFKLLADVVAPGDALGLRGRAAAVAQARAGRELGRHLRDLGVRHIHAHFAHAPASVAMYAAEFIGIPFSFTGHANDLFQRRQLLRRKLERAAFVGCISEWHRALYRSIVDRPDAAYPIIRCGVDTDDLAPAGRSRSDALRVLTVCRLVEKKGVDTLVRAVGLLRERGTPIELVVAGDGPMRAGLESLARELRIDATTRFLGAIDSAAVREQLRQADAFALICRVDANGDKDGIPVVLMEAMASGLPAVSGDLPAIRELVVDGQTGALVPGGDVEATAAVLARLAGDAALRRTLGDAGRQRVIEQFSIRGTIAQLERSILRAAGRSS